MVGSGRGGEYKISVDFTHPASGPAKATFRSSGPFQILEGGIILITLKGGSNLYLSPAHFQAIMEEYIDGDEQGQGHTGRDGSGPSRP